MLNVLRSDELPNGWPALIEYQVIERHYILLVALQILHFASVAQARFVLDWFDGPFTLIDHNREWWPCGPTPANQKEFHF